MASIPEVQTSKVVVDSIHGDIHLTDREVHLIDTASFQRLRHIKQLQMSQVTYPNATHTRFSHSLGVLGMMARVVNVAGKRLGLTAREAEDLRLAALLHDIGHYPYSHLLEDLDSVKLTEEEVGEGADRRPLDMSAAKYPRHEELGREIVTNQKELLGALGGRERAARVADLFTRGLAADQQRSKLIHSSLDMDRLDYLVRDSHAVGTPYGRIDMNYLLNNLRVSPTGMLGVGEKALAAAEHFLLARFFMYRTVYFHKTTWGIQEACKQLLRRLRDAGDDSVPRDRGALLKIARSEELFTFTDAHVDQIVQKAATHRDPVIGALSLCIRNRRPPKLLKEVSVFVPKGTEEHAGTLFMKDCKHGLGRLAKSCRLQLGHFLVCRTPPLTLEERGSHLTAEEARRLPSEQQEELIKVFCGRQPEPCSIVDIKHSLLRVCAGHYFQTFRLYVVRGEALTDRRVRKLEREVASWGTAG
jgi:hypothetical protein